MLSQYKLQDISLYLTETLAEYEVIPANFGWHIHKGDEYCGCLEYQDNTGWQGSALNYLPTELKERLESYTQLNSSVYQTNTYNNLRLIA